MNLTDISPKLLNLSITSYKSQFNDIDDEPCNVVCLLCDSAFVLPTDQKNFLLHLFNEHQLVIGDVDKIASLKRYFLYILITGVYVLSFKIEKYLFYC